MIEVDDTTPDANEPASKARGDERAATRPADESIAARPGDEGIAARPAVEAAATRPGEAFESADAGDAPHVEPLVLQPDFAAGDKSQYHVAELLAYHDRHFVESVYKAILARAPSHDERAHELDELRSGRAGKVEIIERLLSSPEVRLGARRRVRVEGLPSPLMRRLGRLPVVGYLLRLVRALLRLPLSMQHQRQFEIYALAQQQLIVDYLNRTLPQLARADAPPTHLPSAAITPSQQEEIAETLAMFSDALLELSSGHAELQAQVQTQVEQAQAALDELTAAVTAQQQLADAFRREQRLTDDALRREQQLAADTLRREQQLATDALRHEQQLANDELRREQQLANDELRRAQQLAADAQQEFLVQEQQVIVETQQVVLAELREDLRELSARQPRARDEFEAEVRRLRSLGEAAAAARENFSGQA